MSAGISLYDLSRRTHWSKAALGHAETGKRTPSRELAEAVDNALAANGLLIALAATARGQGRNVDDMRRRALLPPAFRRAFPSLPRDANPPGGPTAPMLNAYYSARRSCASWTTRSVGPKHLPFTYPRWRQRRKHYVGHRTMRPHARHSAQCSPNKPNWQAGPHSTPDGTTALFPSMPPAVPLQPEQAMTASTLTRWPLRRISTPLAASPTLSWPGHHVKQPPNEFRLRYEP